MQKISLWVLLLLLLTSCAGSPFLRGHILREHQLDELAAVEKFTKKSLFSLLGSPSFESESGYRWYYVSYRSLPATIFPEEIGEVRTVILSFGENDDLLEVSVRETASWKENEEVEPVAEKTVNPDGDVRLFKELFGRLGSIDFRNR